MSIHPKTIPPHIKKLLNPDPNRFSLESEFYYYCDIYKKTDDLEYNQRMIETIKKVLDIGLNPNIQGVLKPTFPLHQACSGNKPDLVKLLIDYGADVNLVDAKGRSPIYYAILKGSIETINVLIEHGCCLNYKGIHDETPLVTSFRRKDPAIVRFLLEKGCDIEARNKVRNTPIFSIDCREGDTEILKIMIEKGADINAESTFYVTPIIDAFYGKGIWEQFPYDIKKIEFLIRNRVTIPESMKSHDNECYGTLMSIKEKIEKEPYTVSTLLLCVRKFCPESFLSEENLPIDLFKMIFFESKFLVRNETLDYLKTFCEPLKKVKVEEW